jgi:hypothetical protein
MPARAGRHGTNVPRGLRRTAAAPPGRGRFGRMFPLLRAGTLAPRTIDGLVKAMRRADGDFNRDIPAGYTYLAQFIDHDITFDPLSKLAGDNDPDALVNFRTPRFDLDSLYGSGPKDQPFLYDWSSRDHPGAKLLVGCTVSDGALVFDLPRNEQGRALIGDARNDENLIISQLHLLFVRFHNSVVDDLSIKRPAWGSTRLFEEAQQQVRWHYQWIVMHDFLERIVGKPVTEAAIAERCFYKWEDEPFIPLEFSAAAYRFGHSMVRPDYTLNAHVPGPVAIFPDRDHTGELDHLEGFRRLPGALEIDWEFFYELSGTSSHGIGRPLASRRIDTNIATGLFNLPANVGAQRELPRLNLLRGRYLRLPSGSRVARAMHVKRLPSEDLLRDVPANVRDAVRRSPPLWYYILCEANTERGNGGHHLGPVGGQIVAEVLAGLLEADPSSFINKHPAFKPTLPRAARGDFTMPDLVRFALGQPPPDALPPGR